MKCSEIRDLLSPYIDGQLSRKEMAEVREHLLLCPECNREYLLLKEMSELLGTLEFKALPVEFDVNLRAALELEGKPAPAGEGEFEEAIIFAEMEESELEGNSQASDELAAKRKRYRKYGAIAAALLVCVFSAVTAMFYDADLTGGGSDLSGSVGDMLLAEGDGSVVGDGADIWQDGSVSDKSQSADQEGSSGSDTDQARKGHDGDSRENGGSDGVSESSQKTEKLQKNGSSSGGTTDGANIAPAQADAGAAADSVEAGKQRGSKSGDASFDVSNDEAAESISAGRAAPTMETTEGAAVTDSISEAASEESGSSEAFSADSGNSPVIDAAYAAGAKTYNEALDFVSFIADNDREGLIRWITTHSVEKLTAEQAGQLADEYIAKYRVNAN